MPKTTNVSPALTAVLSLCLTTLAFGCNNAGSDLEDTARNISRKSSQKLQRNADANADADADDDDEGEGEGEETDYNAATEDQDMAGGEAAGSSEAEPSGDDSEPEMVDGAKVERPAAGPTSDDSVRCGDGVLDEDELCDFGIEPGEKGACPEASDCEPLDACHAAKLEVRSCWTQCVLGAPVEC